MESERGVALAELLEDVDNLFNVIGEGEQQILVFSGFHQVNEQGIDRYLLGPELLSEEYHGAGETIGEVMVLHRFLEDFLQGARAARGIDDASKGEGKYVVLAQAVCKELGDVARERRRRLVAV